MIKVRLFLILLGLICLAGSAAWGIQTGDPYYLNIPAPAQWREIKSQEDILKLAHIDGFSSISILHIGNTMDIDELKQLRGLNQYDGWRIVVDRPGSEWKVLKSGADNVHLVVYSKDADKKPGFDRRIVAEYYYMTSSGAFILHIQTLSSRWASIQMGVNTILQGFWIGDGKRPVITKSQFEKSSWVSEGGNSSNQNSLAQIVEFSDTPEILWTQTVDLVSKEAFAKASLLTQNGAAYFTSGQHVYAMSLLNGRLSWRIGYSGVIQKGMAINGDTLYFITHAQTSVLYAVSVETGSIVFKVVLQSDRTSSLKVSDTWLVVADGEIVRVLDPATGREQWSRELNVDARHAPALSPSGLLLCQREGALIFLQPAKGKFLWVAITQKTILFSPIIDQKLAYVLLGDKKIDSIQTYDLKNGVPKWTYKLPAGYVLAGPASIAAGKLIVYVRRLESRNLFDEIWSIDSATGKRVAKYAVTTDYQPVVFPAAIVGQILYCLKSNEDGYDLSLVSYDLKSDLRTERALGLAAARDTVLAYRFYKDRFMLATAGGDINWTCFK